MTNLLYSHFSKSASGFQIYTQMYSTPHSDRSASHQQPLAFTELLLNFKKLASHRPQVQTVFLHDINGLALDIVTNHLEALTTKTFPFEDYDPDELSDAMDSIHSLSPPPMY